MQKNIALLPGDGIGEEVVQQAVRVLDAIAQKFGHEFSYTHALIGGAAYDEHQNHFPKETEEVCKASDAILFGSVGGPVQELHLDKWKGCEANSILALRKTFQFHSNFRPVSVHPKLSSICPLKPELVQEGIDMLIIRELVGDLYFGSHETFEENGQMKARDICEYTEEQIRNVAHTAFQAAQKRGKRLHSVDKANVLDTSKLWRVVVEQVAKEYPDVEWEHMLVDNAAMQIVKWPSQFDVMLTSNMFGDILSDAAAVLPGSLGLMPSASLNAEGFGLYEPSGGSAPDIAGMGIANPIAQILSAAMMLKFSFGMIEECDAIEAAINKTLEDGYRTGDIMQDGMKKVGTKEITDIILQNL